MRKDVKKLLKILLVIIALIVMGYIMIAVWILGPALKQSNITKRLEDEGSVVSLLEDCKEMLAAENAWNPSIDYNYVYYFKSGRCPSSDKLQNVEQVQKEFCDRVAKEDPSLHNFYVNNINGGRLCPSNKSDNNSTQQN